MGQCEARTTKGNQCRKSAIPGSIYCKIHESNSEIWAGQLLQIVVLELERRQLTLSAQTIHHAKTVIAGYTASSKQLLDGDYKQFTELVETLKNVSSILHAYVKANFVSVDESKQNDETSKSSNYKKYETSRDGEVLDSKATTPASPEEAARGWAKTVENASYVAGVISSGDNKNPDLITVNKVIKEAVLDGLESVAESELREAIRYLDDPRQRRTADNYLTQIVIQQKENQTKAIKRKGTFQLFIMFLLFSTVVTLTLTLTS